jgi:cysteine desulfurase
VTTETVYLDHNATTPIAEEVRESILPFLEDEWGNPSSLHRIGTRVKPHIEEARARVAGLIGADPSEIVFTGCGTESNNAAIRGLWESIEDRNTVITSRVEHPAVLEPCRYLTEHGASCIELDVDKMGQIDLEELRDALPAGPAIVSLMWANNETGVVFPMAEIADMVKSAGGWIHTDAIQAAGKVLIDVREVAVDMLSLAGHKFNCPKGVGVLFIRRGTPFAPFLLGGSQEAGRRGGTPNVPYIVGIGKAAELAGLHLDDIGTRIAACRDKLEAALLALCPGAQVNGDPTSRLPNTTNISFPGIEGETLLYHLDDAGIAASAGAACSSGSMEPSHVIRAMGVPHVLALGSVRLSLGHSNTEADIDYAISQAAEILPRLK